MAAEPYECDCFQIFLDLDNSKPESYTENQVRFRFMPAAANLGFTDSQQPASLNLSDYMSPWEVEIDHVIKWNAGNKGYIIEIGYTLPDKFTLADGVKMGFDADITDDSDGDGFPCGPH